MFLKELIEEVENDPENAAFIAQGWKPILMVHKEARILVVGQAPGIKTQLLGDVFRDQSGDRLCDWMGVTGEVFHDSNLFAVLPLDFYFPGKAKTGDMPPRKGFSQKWHPEFMKLMPDLKLILLVGKYAQDVYLIDNPYKTLTLTVTHYKEFLPKYFPLVHPSPLNQRWMAKNRWFEQQVLPELKKLVLDIIK